MGKNNTPIGGKTAVTYDTGDRGNGETSTPNPADKQVTRHKYKHGDLIPS